MIGGKVVLDNEQYVVEDNTTLDTLTLSSTTLHAGQSTRGHSHADIDEVYIFIGGSGILEVEDVSMPVSMGAIALINGGDFHKVINDTDEPLVFLCVFNSLLKEREE